MSTNLVTKQSMPTHLKIKNNANANRYITKSCQCISDTEELVPIKFGTKNLVPTNLGRTFWCQHRHGEFGTKQLVPKSPWRFGVTKFRAKMLGRKIWCQLIWDENVGAKTLGRTIWCQIFWDEKLSPKSLRVGTKAQTRRYGISAMDRQLEDC